MLTNFKQIFDSPLFPLMILSNFIAVSTGIFLVEIADHFSWEWLVSIIMGFFTMILSMCFIDWYVQTNKGK